MSFQLAPPDRFDFNRPSDWTIWIKKFERFRSASDLYLKKDSTQVDTLLYQLGDEGETLLASFKLEEVEEQNYQTVVDKFNEYFGVEKNTVYERARFFSRKQQEGESTEIFLNELLKLSGTCELGELKESIVRDIFIIGLKDENLSKSLQRDRTMTLEKARTTVRQFEMVTEQNKIIREDNALVDAVTSKWKIKNNQNKFEKKEDNGEKTNFASSSSCPKCGSSPFHQFYKCPANNQNCLNCKQRGHYSKCCRNKKVNELVSSDQNGSFLEYLGEVTLEVNSDKWMIDVLLNQKVVNFKIDTGADVTVIGDKLCDELKLKISKTVKRLFGSGNKELKVIGVTKCELNVKNITSVQDVYVVEDQSIALLGRPALEELKLVNISSITEVEKNQEKIDIISKYPEVFNGLGKLNEPYEIQLSQEATPFAVSCPRRVALPLIQQVKDEIDRMIKDDVIAPVNEPTDWCAPIVVVPQKGKVRICCDYTELNKFVRREKLQLPSVEESLATLGKAKIFSLLDASRGFWQVPLTENCQKLTTFITPFGRFYFKRLPFGINSGPEHFQRRMQEILVGLPGVINQADDILVFADDNTQHNERLTAVILKLKQHGITLNQSKCEFYQQSVKFLGQFISEGISKPDKEKTEAIYEMEEPKNVSEVRRFLGMVNYMMKYVPNLSDKTQPIRELLIKKNQFMWGQPQKEAFQKLKDEILKQPVLALYDRNAETRISADSSNFGLGCSLDQKQSNNEWKMVMCASRCLTSTEKRYAQVEKEALASTWACEKFRNYILGKRIQIITDHKPLVEILGKKPVGELTARLQRFRMRLMCFDYFMTFLPGKYLFVADTLSRTPVEQAPVDEIDVLQEQLFINNVIAETPFSDKKLNEILEKQQLDPESAQIRKFIGEGFCKNSIFWKYKNELTLNNGLVMKGNRIFIPKELRGEIISKLHGGHLGIVKCRRRAHESVWWPNLSQQLKELVENCRECIQLRVNKSEPLMPTKLPERPWTMLGMDLMELEKSYYLVIEDYYSRWIEVIKTDRITSLAIISRIKNVFARFGIPETVRSDGGTQFTSDEFKQFAKDYGFQQEISSPTFAQSNGASEKGVNIAKNILIKSRDDPNLGLLSYRSTPLECGRSPAELLFGRKLRTDVPVISSELVPSWKNIMKEVEEKENQLKLRNKKNFDSSKGAKELSQLKSGAEVWITDMKRWGTVVKDDKHPRSYIVDTEKGAIRRNRKHLVELKNEIVEEDVGDKEPLETFPISPRFTSPESPPFLGFPESEARPSNTPTTRYGRKVIRPKRLNL